MTHDTPQMKGLSTSELMLTAAWVMEKCHGVDANVAKHLRSWIEDWFGPKGKKGGHLKLVE